MGEQDSVEQIQSMGPCAVLRGGFEPWDFMRVSKVLERFLGLHVLDARQLARKAPGIIADEMPALQAERLAQELKAIGVSTILVPTRLLMPLPLPFQCRGMLFEGQRMIFLGEDDRKRLEADSKDFALLCVAQLFREKEVGFSATAPAFVYGTMGYTRLRVREVPISSKSSKETWPFVLCLIGMDPPTQVRIYADKFNYSCIEDKRASRSEDAFPHLARRLAECCPDAITNPGAEAILHGEDLDKYLRFEKERDFEDYAYWFAQVSLLH